jgi:hypothetical protein
MSTVSGTWRGPNIVKDSSLVLYLDASAKNSYNDLVDAGAWKDMSGNNNNGTLINGPTFNSASGGSIVFDGTNNYATASDNATLRPTSFSIDVWFRPTSFNSLSTIISKPFNGPPWSTPFLSYMIRLNNTGTVLECSTNIGGTYRALFPNYTFVVNTIYNVTFTLNSSTGAFVIYLNASVLSSTTFPSGAISYSTPPLLIGTGYGASPVSEFFPGNIYNVKIYNTVLSATQITQNFNATRGRFGI